MTADVIKKIFSSNHIKYGNATVATGAKHGPVAHQEGTYEIQYDTLDTIFEARLTDRFDDPTYYTA
jgi:hypothetical protein